MIQHSHLQTAVQILDAYTGSQPFSLFIREFFRADKKYGSRDRKQITHLCYCYFRLGRMAAERLMEERLLIGLFLCSATPNLVLEKLRPHWNEQVDLPLDDKMHLCQIRPDPDQQFPASSSVSPVVANGEFFNSQFIQPDLFIRVRPQKQALVVSRLAAAGLEYRQIQPSSIALPNSTRINELIKTDSEAVVQDLSSQQVETLFPAIDKAPIRIWDCCAASGGKSIMAVDHYGDTDLTVSDIRENILHNLRQRFENAGIKKYKSFVADLASSTVMKNRELAAMRFNLIIADLPCTGSGTWGRTPEHLVFFREEKISYYSSLQRTIIDNSTGLLASDGYYLYITCSVYSQENEEAVEYIKGKGLKLLSSQYFKGYQHKADTMFAALFTK